VKHLDQRLKIKDSLSCTSKGIAVDSLKTRIPEVPPLANFSAICSASKRWQIREQHEPRTH
jgi:hypothetical protein